MASLHIPILPDWLSGSHTLQYRGGYCKLEYLWRCFQGALQLLNAWVVASVRVALLYETFETGPGNPDVYA